MAAVFTHVASGSLIGGFKMVIGTIAMDSSYPTGGETLDLSEYFPGDSIYSLSSELSSGAGYILGHDGGTATAGKIEAWWADYDAGADGALIEVANTTDLSALTAVKVVIIGN